MIISCDKKSSYTEILLVLGTSDSITATTTSTTNIIAPTTTTGFENL